MSSLFPATPALLLLGVHAVSLLLYAWLRMRRYVLSAKVVRVPPLCEPAQCPPLTLVVTTHGCGSQWERNLERMAEQDYPNLDIVVVLDAAAKEATEVESALLRLEARYSVIRHTVMPRGADCYRFLPLALTVGIKTARTPWIAIAHPDTCPSSPQWLRRMVSYIDDETNLVAAPIVTEGHATMRELRRTLRQCNFVQRRKRMSFMPFAGFLIKRASFFSLGGFGRVQSAFGNEATALADNEEMAGYTAFATHPEARLVAPARVQLGVTEATHYVRRKMRLGGLSTAARVERWCWNVGGIAGLVALAALGSLDVMLCLAGEWQAALLCSLPAVVVVLIAMTLLLFAKQRLGWK